MESATVVLYPSAGIGHLVSMVELGKLIHTHHPSLSVTILILPLPFETASTDTYINTVSTANPSITFHQLPSVPLPPDFPTDFVDIAFHLPELHNPTVHKTIAAISQRSDIKAVVLDFFSNAAFQVSRYTLSLPTYYFYTTCASGLCTFLHFPTIHNTNSKSIKDQPTTYLHIPGVPPIQASDMPPAIHDRESYSYKTFIFTSTNMAASSGIIVNSFVELEERAVDTLRQGRCIPDAPTPPVYLVGPLIATGDQAMADPNQCLKWLDSQPTKSVVFLCFGSMGVFKEHQLKEMAVGLERSGRRFLWVVRKPQPDDERESNPVAIAKELDLDSILPQGFLTRTREKGLVVKNWAPQPAILSHESVGGFVSHCGWNSALEAVVAGVPMVAWPLYAEQKMNRVYLVHQIKVALAVKMSSDGFVTAEAVEESLGELMGGVEGRVVRERILELSGKAKAAAEDGGSSRIELFKLTQSWIDRVA